MIVKIEVRNDAGEIVFDETLFGVSEEILIPPGAATPGIKSVTAALLAADWFTIKIPCGKSDSKATPRPPDIGERTATTAQLLDTRSGVSPLEAA